MKALLLSLLYLSAIASHGVNVKVADGHIAQCKTKSDVYRYKLGAYQASLNSVGISTDSAHFNLSIKFLSCEANDGEVTFSEVGPFSAFKYQVLTIDSQTKEVSVQPEEVRVIAYKDGVYQKIADIELDNISNQNIDLDIRIDDLLTHDEIIDLNEGKEVIGNFDYQLQKIVRINDSKFKDIVNYGAFRVHFKASLDESQSIKIEMIK